jgi:hypothetical protein
MKVDGRLDEAAWGQYLRQYRGHGLRDLKTGDKPKLKTSFLALWAGGPPGGSLYLGIICEEPDIAGLVISGKNGDPALLNGDMVELLLETQAHSYYHLAVNPAGALVEFDRQGGKTNRDWTSRAEVAAYAGDGFWSAEMRIPVPGQDQLGDPLHEVAGRRPSKDFPWFINVGRQRVRGGTVERQSWSPTGAENIHDAMKFGKMFVR